VIAALCAAGLVLASAGFGATYAWMTGSQYGLLLGVDAMLMAVALEGAKPLAVAAAFAAFRSWAVIRGVALALLAVAAIAYSLTSELALIAGNRGDLAATRGAIIAQNDARQARLRAAQSELASLASSRAAAEVEADVAKLFADNPRAGDCHVMDGPVSRSVCPQVAALNGEIARTRRRAELQAVIAGLTDAMPTSAGVGAADPASSALSTYLAALGIAVPIDVLARWLTLVPVLALELGAALAAVLIDAVTAEPKAITKTAVASKLRAPGITSTAHPSDVSGQPSDKPQKTNGRQVRRPASRARLAKDRRTRANAAAQTRIIEALKKGGGKIEAGSVRKVAGLIGARKSTVHSAMALLLAAGTVTKVGRALVLG
jgi:hypothetical protein